MVFKTRMSVLIAVAVILAIGAPEVFAQFAGGGFGQGGGFGGVGGVSIDAKGVVVPIFQKDVALKLAQKRLEAFAKKNSLKT